MRNGIIFASLATLGVLAGVALALFGMPYTRMDDRVFAELYHGTEDTTGTIHFAIDCEVLTAASDDDCSYPWFADPFDRVGFTIGNSLGSNVQIAAFNFTIRTDQTLVAPDVRVDSAPWLNANPDFFDPNFGSGWECGPPAPDEDLNPSASIADSSIGCFGLNTVLIPAGEQHVMLAQVFYDVVAPESLGDVSVPFTLLDVGAYDETFTELGTCRPIIAVASPCFDAEATITRHTLPTPTYTPTATATPVPDADGDGVPDATDNCPNAANADQLNTDRNLISNAPVFAQMDTTRAKSDGLGDVCDDDDDNDGVDDLVEQLHCPYGMWATNPLGFDTDGDRFHDGAECGLYTDATRPELKPTLAQCGPTTDGDNDGLSARLEYCFYATSDATADSDGDGVKDGCEAASFNNDNIVNVADLGMLASEVSRVPPPSKLVNLDVNKDGVHNVADLGMVAARVGKCP